LELPAEEITDEEILSYTVELGDNRFGYPALREFYGDLINPTFKTIIQHLALAKKAFPGVDFDFLNHLHRLRRSPSPTDKGKIFLADQKAICKALVQIVSLLHLPNSYTHPTYDDVMNDDNNSTIRNNDEYFHLEDGTFKVMKIDFTFGSNTVRAGDVSGSFLPVEKPNLDDLLKKAISFTTTASTSTICLFGNMGPSPSLNTQDENTHLQLTMNYFSQPHFNSRAMVDADRIEKMLDTSAGKISNYNLISHGVTVVPYSIKYSFSYNFHDTEVEYIGNDSSESDKKPGGTESSVRSCFTNAEATENLCGIPIAEPVANARYGIADIFKILLGYEWTEIVAVQNEEIQQILLVEDDDNTYQEKGRLRNVLLTWLLIQLVDREYQGFRSIQQWMKLHWRLTRNHVPLANALPAPRTIHGLVYQCMVLIQASSTFRLAVIGGQGRHFGAIHSLLGVHPTKTLLPLLESSKGKVPPFKLELLGSSNPKIDIVEISANKKTYDQKLTKELQKLSDDIQKRDELIVRIQITGFLQRWCQHCDSIRIHERLISLEFTEKRDKILYTSPKFANHEKLVPFMAIEFMKKQILEDKNDTKFLRHVLSEVIKSTSQQKHDISMPTILEGDSLVEKANWLETHLKFLYKSGYVSRFQNIWGKHFAPLLFVMSHGFYWLLERRATSTLTLFLRDAGAGTLEWDEEIYKFPNPEAFVTDTDDTTLFTDECKMTNLFIQRRNIKVRNTLLFH
jgi:hypothetical protein